MTAGEMSDQERRLDLNSRLQAKVCGAALYWAYRHGLTEPPGQSWRRIDERDLDAELLAAVREYMGIDRDESRKADAEFVDQLRGLAVKLRAGGAPEAAALVDQAANRIGR